VFELEFEYLSEFEYLLEWMWGWMSVLKCFLVLMLELMLESECMVKEHMKNLKRHNHLR